MNDDLNLDAGLEPIQRGKPDYTEIVNRNAARTQLDPALISAVMQQESGGNAGAVSPKGARGPMQLMPATARRFGVKNPHDPEQAIRGGSDYLKFLSDRYNGNRDLVLAGYNAGEGAVDKFGGIPPYRETRKYVQAINQRLGPQRDPLNIDAGLVQPSSEQTPPSTKQRQQSAIPPTPGQSAPSIEQVLANIGNETTRKTNRLIQQANQQQQVAQQNANLFRQLGQQRTIDQAQREQEQAARTEAQNDLASERGPYGSPTWRGALRLISDPTGKLSEIFKSDDQIVNERAQEKLHQGQVATDPEVTEIRKEYGAMPTLVRSVAAPVIGRGSGGLLKVAGGIASAFGIAPNRLSDWANKRAEIIETGSTLAPLREEQSLRSLITGHPELKEVDRGWLEKLATAAADVGVGVGQVVLLKKATNLPLNQLLALEAAAKNSDEPTSEQLARAGESYALGTALESNLSKGANAALFGVPTAASTGYEVSQGRMSPLDAAIQTGIQAGAGAFLTPRENVAGARLRDIAANEPPADTSTFAPPTPRGGLRERLQKGINEPQTKVQPPVEAQREVVEQKRDIAPENVPILPEQTETSAQTISQLSSEQTPQRFYHRDFGEVTESSNQQGVGKRKVRVIASDGSEHIIKRSNLSGVGNARAVPIREQPAETQPAAQPPEPATPKEEVRPPSLPATSAQKAAVDVEREQRGVEPLPFAPETKADRQLLDDAKRANEARPQEPQRLVQEVLDHPRALSDKETVQLDLYKQQLKNEHSDLMKQIDAATDPQEIKSLRARTDAIESEFDAVDRAWRASGTEKGRSLRSQRIAINEDFDLVSMKTRLKAAKGEPLNEQENADVEVLHKRIADLEARVVDAESRAVKQQADRAVAKVRRQSARTETKASLDAEAVVIKQNIANELARIKSSSVQPSGLAGLDPEGKLTKELIRYVHNRAKANLQLPLESLIDEAHELVKDIGATRRQVMEAIVGYGKQSQPRSPEAKRLAEINAEINRILKEQDVVAGRRSSRSEGPKRDYQRNQTRLKQLQKQRAEYERRVAASDFGPRAKRPVADTPEVTAAREAAARAKNQFLRKEREFKQASRGPAEKAADLLIRWGRAAKLSYVSTLGKLSGAATGRMVMSPIENLVGEIPHRLSPELSRRATVEGGGFDTAAEVAALWKSGRFKQVLNQLTKGSSDLDVLYGGGKGIDKEMSGEGILGIPGRVHGAMKEYPRQAETDRAFIKVLRNYERAGKDIADPNVQLAARMEAVASGDRARFQQRNFISDTFNEAMGSLERKGGLAKGVAKAGRFIFPITRVPVNVAGETLNYTLGIPRAAIETAIRGGVKNLTPEQANNIMRAYKKGGVGLAVMTYAYFHPQQFGGYYQKGEQRKENEPQFGEVMFFGHRIPKWATHIPIIEAGQLAATVRRVSDKLQEKGEDKGEATIGGVTAGAKGVASGIPFYETPARFFTGQEGARGWAEVAGQQAKGMIPGFVQEGAQLLDKDAAGNPIKRKPAGSFAQRVGQTVELGIPGLRSRVPLNERAVRSERKSSLIDQYRNGSISSGDLEQMDLTDAERSAIRREGKISEKQVRLTNMRNADVLDRFERMDEAAREDLRDIMEKKAWNLVHSDTLTEAEKEANKERLERLGITPRKPQSSTRSAGGAFRQRTISPF